MGKTRGYQAMASTLVTASRTCTWLVLLCILCSCAKVAVQHPFTISAEPQGDDDYQLGPEDIIEVLVWKNADLSKVVTVRPDGRISLPLIGDVQASGLTAIQVKEVISGKLEEYYKEPPLVSLIVQQANSYVIYVMGEVQRPAQYQVKRGTTFLQAIALAGGFTPFASTNNIVVLRKSNENNLQISITIRYKDIVSGRNLGNNILLRPGDTVVIG
jgi:polysaccharide export outer membrane protein